MLEASNDSLTPLQLSGVIGQLTWLAKWCLG
jgi:hypothetical protein